MLTVLWSFIFINLESCGFYVTKEGLDLWKTGPGTGSL